MTLLYDSKLDIIYYLNNEQKVKEMNYKYLKLILLLTVSIQAAPKVFNSLGREMESFQQENCKTYQMVTSLPEKIKKECSVFDTKVNNAFKVGYKLDPYIDNEISEKKLNKYLFLLQNLDKRKENILTLIYSEVKKARKQNNTKYYRQLIANNKTRLYSSDYEFMGKNKDVFAKDKRYLSHLQYMKDLDEQRKNQPKEKDNYNTQTYQKKVPSRTVSPTYYTSNTILNNCRAKWKTNYSMVKYCMDKQTKAKRSLPRQNSTILNNCRAKWKTNYSMVKYCVDKQTKAKRELGI